MRPAVLEILFAVAALGQGTVMTTLRPPQNAPPAGNGVIEGTVHDKVTGEPIRGAAVGLGVATGMLRVSTDDAGHFTFRALPPGTYMPNAQASGYTPNNGPLNFGYPSSPVQLDQNTEKAKIDLFLYPMATVSGHVFNEAGEPVGNCQVAATTPQSQPRGGPAVVQVAFTSTNNDGEYHLRNLLRGHYALWVRCDRLTVLPHAFMKRNDPAIPRLVYPHQYLGGADFKSAQKLTVGTGSHLEGIDIRLSRVPAARLDGVINGFTAQDFNLFVSLESTEESSNMMASYSSGANPQTGKFTFPNVAPGEYRLVASINSPSHFVSASAIVNVQANAANTAELTLAPLPAVKGVVIEAPPPTQAGAAAEFLSITGPSTRQIIFEALSPQRFMPPAMAPIEKDGSFLLPTGLPPGRWRVHINGLPGYVNSLRVDDADAPRGEFVLGPGNTHNLRIEMGLSFGEVDVSVEGAAGSSRNEWMVTAIAEKGFGPPQNILVQPDGTARIHFLPPGRYRVFVLPARASWSFTQEPRLVDRFSSRGQTIDVPEGGKVQVTAAPIRLEEIAAAIEEIE